MNKIVDRILELSKRYGLSHIGSCISVSPILEEIYSIKKPNDIVILDNAHAHLAHLAVKEAFGILRHPMLSLIEPTTLEYYLNESGIHCDRKAGCDASGGSLGHGLGIAIGMALSDPRRKVYCILSEGTLMEGSNWEALRIKEDLDLYNLEIYANLNGYSAVAKIDKEKLSRRIHSFCPSVHVWFTENGEGFEGLEGHYKTL